MMVLYIKEITRCDHCPNIKKTDTPRAGCADDFTCTKLGRVVKGYVEWESEWKGFRIPLDCPLRGPAKNEPLYDVGL